MPAKKAPKKKKTEDTKPPMPVPGFLLNGPTAAPLTVALAHGAGAPMDHPFMNDFAEGLGNRGFQVARFEFPYMAYRRATHKRPPPDRPSVLIETWKSVIDHFGPERLVISGKSMGGRIASMMASDLELLRTPVRGLVCLGYPFHPPGKPDAPRTGHLQKLDTPTLILQGERDTLGSKEEVRGYELDPKIRIHWLPDGDHGFKPRVKSGLKEADNIFEAIEMFAKFLRTL